MADRDVKFGMLILLSHTYAIEGVNTLTQELWAICDRPSAKYCRDLGLVEFDREAMNALRADERR